MLYSRIDSKAVSDKPSHPVKLAANWVEFGPKTVRSARELTIFTAGELGVKKPPLLSNATRSVNPALVMVAGNETGIVSTESIICIRPPT